MVKLPRYIGICGHPTAGKSLVQSILRREFDVQPIDDGYNLRDYAIRHMGASPEDVQTQEGKLRPAYINGEPVIDARTGEHMTWRLVLGRLGNHLEALFGTWHMPQAAMLRADAMFGPYKSFSFGSVRKDQGWAYKKKDGVILGVDAPWAEPTGNDFDRFDKSAVDFWINNDVKDEAALLEEVKIAVEAMQVITERRAA